MLHISRNLLIMGLIFSLNQGCQGQDEPGRTDRKPAVAGRFYPGDAASLRDSLASMFAAARPRSGENVLAIVCPHAGYVFSGRVAASGFNQADPDRQFDNVFIIASSHHVSFPGASIYTPGDYVTPLGKVKVNTALANELIRDHKIFTYNPEADREEHSVEVQVPFLQYHLKKGFNLVPIVLGTQDDGSCRQIAEALEPYFNDRNLFVFSTDFSHYPSYTDATSADKATCDAILSGDPAALLKVLKEYRTKNIPNLATNLCGWTNILVLLNMVAHHPDLKINPVQYMNSGDSKYGDKEQVVGYWALAVTGHIPAAAENALFGFSKDEKVALLRIARTTIAQYLSGKPVPAEDPARMSENLKVQAGAFVTLKEDGQLRGCIGRFSADIPLYRLIGELAIASSTQDTRFDPVSKEETGKLEIEISVLSPMKKINSPSEIVLGKHGIYIKKGYRSGTFLPQVATETGWTLDEFLGHCSRDKAGLGWDGWKDADLYTYEACIFSEKELGLPK